MNIKTEIIHVDVMNAKQALSETLESLQYCEYLTSELDKKALDSKATPARLKYNIRQLLCEVNKTLIQLNKDTEIIDNIFTYHRNFEKIFYQNANKVH